MGILISSAIMSLDGYVADAAGDYDWAEPDDEVHAFLNELESGVGTYLLGRRTYEELIVWDTMPLDDQPAVMRDFAGIWRAAEKIVYSTTLESASTARTRIERDLIPQEVRRVKEAATGDLTVGGPGLAAQAFRAGLVDECQLFVLPIVVGGGTRALPDNARVDLELLDERRFRGGAVHLRYRVRT